MNFSVSDSDTSIASGVPKRLSKVEVERHERELLLSLGISLSTQCYLYSVRKVATEQVYIGTRQRGTFVRK